jgi:hypothetical protein
MKGPRLFQGRNAQTESAFARPIPFGTGIPTAICCYGIASSFTSFIFFGLIRHFRGFSKCETALEGPFPLDFKGR